jgi:hypothetical protein
MKTKIRRVENCLIIIRPNEDAWGIRLRWHGAFYNSHNPSPAVDVGGWEMRITGWDFLFCVTITKARRTGRKANIDEVGRFKRSLKAMRRHAHN